MTAKTQLRARIEELTEDEAAERPRPGQSVRYKLIAT